MKILEVVDSPWAIGALAKSIQSNLDHHRIQVLAIHPKEYRNDTDHWNRVFAEAVEEMNPDVVHFHYWDTAFQLAKLPCLSGRKKILTHHNQKNLLSHSWEDFDNIVVHTQKAKRILKDAGYDNVTIIQHGIDVEFFRYAEDYQHDSRLVGYVGRVVPWKNLYEVLKATKEVNGELLMMGKIDRADYWQKCVEDFSDQMDERFGTPRQSQPSTYAEMAVYVGFSSDGIEEGPLGLLEAMACGIPVITTPAGEANDIIEDGVNGLLVDFDDTEGLVKKLRFFFSMSQEEKDRMRDKAWHTVKSMSEKDMARKYERLYYKTAFRKDLVSVVIPSCRRPKEVRNLIQAYAEQTYAPIEVIVAVDDHWDSVESREYETTLEEMKKQTDVPIRYLFTDNEGYGIAQARNSATIIASGNYIIYNDDRFVPEKDAVEMFVNRISGIKEKVAIWGDKGAGKRSFIENFFIVRKRHIVQAGMFCERIVEYGGQSEEIRTRLLSQDFILSYEPSAKSKQQFGTHSRREKRYQIFRSKIKLRNMYE